MNVQIRKRAGVTLPEKPFPNSLFALAGSLRVHYRVWLPASSGKRNPVLLIHGFGGSTRDWETQAARFAERGHPAVSADIPPFGYSDRSIVKTSRNIRADWFWKTVAFVERECGLPAAARWILVGHSLGTTVAGAMAALRPEKAAALILVSGPGDDPAHGKSLAKIAGHCLPPIWPFTALVEKGLRDNFCTREGVRRILSDVLNREPTAEEIESYRAPWLVTGTARAVARNVVLGLKVDAGIPSRSLALPLLFLWGTADRVIPLSACRNLRFYLPPDEIAGARPASSDQAAPFDLLEVEGGRFHLIGGGGHGIIHTHAAIVDDVIARFIDKNNGKGSA